MGAWGTGIFDNDEAADWGFALADRGMAYVRESLDVVKPGYLDAGAGTAALAAAETVARLAGRGLEPSAYTEDVDAWVAEQSEPPTEELLELARSAVERVGGEGSELAELWEDVEKGDPWRAELDDLLMRLG